jgi:hypothetical protein
MAKLPSRILKTTDFSLLDLIHLVDVSDTSQDPTGSSFKARLGDVLAALNMITLTVTEFQSMITGMSQKNTVWYQVTNAVSNTRTLMIVYGSISVDGVIAYDVRSGEIGRWNWATDTWISVSAPYKKYVALLTQTGTNAPTATVLENTLGVVPTFEYAGIGDYRILATGLFIQSKTWYNITNTGPNGFGGQLVTMEYLSTDRLTINSGTTDGNGANDYLVNCPIEIRVYP